MKPAWQTPALFLSLVGLLSSIPTSAQIALDREPPGPSSRMTGLAITEIMYNPRPIPGLSTNLTKEFIELFNSKPWDEDISGFSITGLVSYVFPANTVLRPGAYLVVARVPDIIRTNYNITNVFGPWLGADTNRLSVDGGTVQLLNRQGAVILSVTYADSPPWPEAADGTGHSLVLARPSYGENNFRAWSESDVVGGSPGGPDPIPNEPLASIFINEWQNHSDPVDWVELYNHSNAAVDLSGAQLTDNPQGTNAFHIPNGTMIPARGFMSWDQTQLGFELFAGGETIFLWNSNKTRIIDVIDFRGASNNVAQGRWPDGGPNIYGMSTNTRGAPNAPPRRYPVVISEIMYNPISGNVDDEYVEIHNRSSSTISLAGWEFVAGINYVFPTNALTMAMPPGADWVIGRNLTNLMGIYTNLSTNVNLLGPYTGTLANGGERLLLAAADYDQVPNPGGGSMLAKLPVPVSDLIYGDGGKWGQWSDGLGSSLELIDVEADERFPSNWADSNDTGESAWTAIEWTGPLGESLGTPANDSVMIMLEGTGECLVDEVEVRVDNGPNLVANGGFESGLTGWTLQGSHDFSTIENEGFAGSKSLHVRAGSRGDNQSNRILSAPFAEAIPPTAGTVSIRVKARWLRGLPEVLVRLHGSATEAYGRMALPRRLGSPGAVNSRRVANAGPAIYEVKHSPLLPAANETVVVTARIRDPQPIAAFNLRYRIDPSPTYTDVAMRDDGTGPDTIANDGIFSGAIPGQPAGNVIAFYLEGRDNQSAVGTFPQDVFPQPGFDRCWPIDALAREGLVRWGEVQMPGDFATYHLWVSAVNSNRWQVRNAMDNTPTDGTFVYNNSRVIYDALPLFSGSPWHRTNSTTGPAGLYRVDYVMNFPEDDEFLGTTDFVLANPGNPDRLTISDLSAVAEQTVYKVFEGLGMVNNHRRYIHFFVNGSQRSAALERPGNFIMEDSQQPNGDMIGQWFSNDAGGQLFKLEDWFEFENNGFDITSYNDADLARRPTLVDGQPTLLPGTYRFQFRKRSVNVGASANDYSTVFQLIDAVSPAENPNSPMLDLEALSTVVDWEAWMRHFSVQRAVGNWDSYGWERGKNDYLYQTAAGFVHMPWDIDYSLGLGRPANEPLFASSDSRVLAMFNTPAILRAYWRAFADLVAGPFSNANLDPFIDARVAALTANNVNIDLDAVAAIKSYIADRRAFLLDQLATVAAPFAIDGPGTFSTANNLVVLTGTAPVGVKDMSLNGVVYPVTWTSATNFSLRVVVYPGDNNLVFQGLDRFGVPVAGASNAVTVQYTGPVANPYGALVITELMYRPAAPNAQFIEIINRSALNFDLWGWRMAGVNLTFPPGSIVTNGQTIVLAQNRAAFRAAYGNIPVFAIFGGNLAAQGEAVALIRPGALGDEMINGVHYEAGAPWVSVTNGVSLQLIDSAQDNSRPSNWAVDPATGSTPGAPNSVAAVLPPYDPLWINEVQIDNLTGLLDNAGESEPFIELYNSGTTPVSLDGYYLATSFTNDLTHFAFPAGITLAPGEFKLVWADGEPGEATVADPHTNFRLDRSGNLALVRVVSGTPQITDYLTWTRLGANVSYGAFPDGQLVYRLVLYTPTPRGTNISPPLRLFINEWMAGNSAGIRDPADNAQDDWFELYNGEASTVDLSGFYLSDDPAMPTKYRVPTNGQYRVLANSYLLVWADNQTSQNSGARSNLHVNFKLSGSSGNIVLTAPDGLTTIDSIAYGLQTDNVGEGRYSDGSSARYFMSLLTGNSTPGAPNTIASFNSPPRFPTFPRRIVQPGQNTDVNGTPIIFRAFDPDGQAITYSFEFSVTGVQTNSAGQFRWTVPTNQPPGDYFFTVRATDSGVPPRSDTTTFIVTVVAPGASVTVITPPPVIESVFHTGGQATFTIATTPGRTYRVFYTDDLSTASWHQLDRDFVAAANAVSLSDPGTSSHRFYRVQQLD